jgi:sterol desaturase/sphingolipid hydroxylase (fatty acid hydroxylase superfamily)
LAKALNGWRSAIPTLLAIAGLIVGSFIFGRLFRGTAKEWASQLLEASLIIYGTMIVYSLVERIRPAGPHKSTNANVINLQVSALYVTTTVFAGGLAAFLAAALNRRFHLGWIDLRFAADKGLLALGAATLLAYLLFDFFYYWFHRLQHTLPLLWQEHKFHHMDEQLSALTTIRQHWLEDFLRIPVIALPMAVVFKLDQIDPFSLGLGGTIVAIVSGSWSTFIHSNLKIHLGGATRIFVGPQTHRIHHSRLPQHHDRNFAAYFPIWDVVFGTYYAPARDEFPPTGVDGEKDFRSLGEAIIFPFREWHRMFEAWRTRTIAST